MSVITKFPDTQTSASNTNGRIADYPISDIFLNRWSPRAFSGESIPDVVLNTLFEAVRWAPSSTNSQPWRLLYARHEQPDFERFLGVINARNQRWAKNASALIVVVSRKFKSTPGGEVSTLAPQHSFDTGAAWGLLALQASLLGWVAHAIGGFDHGAARDALNIPDDYHVDVMIAVGKQTDKSVLPEDLQLRELPSKRLPISGIAFAGGFPRE
jgi:nitroreductase